MSDLSQGDLRHNNMANAITALSMDAVQQANSGHPGMPMGLSLIHISEPTRPY